MRIVGTRLWVYGGHCTIPLIFLFKIFPNKLLGGEKHPVFKKGKWCQVLKIYLLCYKHRSFLTILQFIIKLISYFGE